MLMLTLNHIEKALTNPVMGREGFFIFGCISSFSGYNQI